MLQSIEEAAENFCIHQIRQPYRVENGALKTRTLIAFIDINAKDTKSYRVYVAATKSLTQQVSKIFLEEDESDEETLQDMLLEMTNLIVGSAKVIAQERDEQSFNIGTPYFEKFDTFDLEHDDAKSFYIAEDHFCVAIKELDA